VRSWALASCLVWSGCATLLGINDTELGDAAVLGDADVGDAEPGDAEPDARADAGPNLCGNGLADPGEECDMGVRNDDNAPAGCTRACRRTITWLTTRASTTFHAAYGVRAGPGGLAIAGARLASPGVNEAWVMAMTAAGMERWTRAYAGGTAESDNGYGAVVAADGRVVLSGSQDQASATAGAAFVRGYDAAGAILFTNVYPITATTSGAGFDADLAPSGFVVAGLGRVSGTDTASLYLLSDSGGFSARIDSTLEGVSGNVARRVRALADGYVYVGWGPGAATMSIDAYARRIKAGSVLWTYRDPPLAGPELAHGIDVCGDDTWVCGWNAQNAWIARLDAQGRARWRKDIVGAVPAQCADVACAPDGSSIVVWDEPGATGFTHRARLRRYDGDGNVAWDRAVVNRGGVDAAMLLYSLDWVGDAVYTVGIEVPPSGATESVIRRYAP